MIYRGKKIRNNKIISQRKAYLKKNQITNSLSPEGMNNLINKDLQGLIDQNISLAQEAVGFGDRVLAEYHYQHAEYYTRLMCGGIEH